MSTLVLNKITVVHTYYYDCCCCTVVARATSQPAPERQDPGRRDERNMRKLCSPRKIDRVHKLYWENIFLKVSFLDKYYNSGAEWHWTEDEENGRQVRDIALSLIGGIGGGSSMQLVCKLN